MRLRITNLALAAACLALAGCQTTGEPVAPVAAPQVVNGAKVEPDIQRILAGGGLNPASPAAFAAVMPPPGVVSRGKKQFALTPVAPLSAAPVGQVLAQPVGVTSVPVAGGAPPPVAAGVPVASVAPSPAIAGIPAGSVVSASGAPSNFNASMFPAPLHTETIDITGAGARRRVSTTAARPHKQATVAASGAPGVASAAPAVSPAPPAPAPYVPQVRRF